MLKSVSFLNKICFVILMLVLVLYFFIPYLNYYIHIWVYLQNQATITPILNLVEKDINLIDIQNQQLKALDKYQCLNSKDCIIIPKINVNMQLISGKSSQVLNKGAWITPKSTNNNLIIAGHRMQKLPPQKDTFYNLDKLSEYDKIILILQNKKSVYNIIEIKQINKNETINLKTDFKYLTLYTCSPLGANNKRLIINAILQ